MHPEIDNPEYSPDPHLYAYDSFGVIGLDLWQVGGDPLGVHGTPPGDSTGSCVTTPCFPAR